MSREIWERRLQILFPDILKLDPRFYNREKEVNAPFAGMTGGRKIMPSAPHDDLLSKDDKAFQ